MVCVLSLLAGYQFIYAADPKTKTFGNVVEFNQTRHGSFDSAVQEADIVVVDFYAPWCGPCKQLGPRITQLAQELTHIKFIKVDIDANEGLAQKYHVRSIPQLLFFKKGVLQKGNTLQGVQPLNKIKDTIKQLC